MARDVTLDLEASSPAAGLLRPPPAASPIAQERVGPGRPSILFVVLALVLAVASTVVALVLGPGAAATHSERIAAHHASGVAGLGLMAGRLLSALAAGLAVAGVAVAGRRLSHSGPAGLLAAALVAADPGFLLGSRLALPLALEVAGLAWALAFAASPIPLLHWLSGLALGVAAFIDPWAAIWVLPIAALLLLRGHIYAAPQHLVLAVFQVAILPIAGAVLHFVTEGSATVVPACLDLDPWARLSLMRIGQPSPGLVLLPDPMVWLGGGGALLFLGLGGVAFALARFRVARAPGRLQLRVVSPMPPVLARGAWLLVLAILAPPAAWLPLFAIALAMGVRELGEDAPGFGAVLAVVLLAFAGLVLARAFGGIIGSDGGVQEALQMVPWARTAPC